MARRKAPAPKPDIQGAILGSIVQLAPVTEAGREWLQDNVDAEGWQWLGYTLNVDVRFAGAIIEGAQADGLIVVGA